MLRLLAVGAVLVSGAGTSRRVENRIAGFAARVPPGWSMWVDPADGSSTFATYRVRRVTDVGEQPPAGETWLLVHDGGPLWALPAWARRIGPLPRTLPPESTFEGFGRVRTVRFRAEGHVFDAWVKGVPREGDTLGLLRSIRLTPYGRSLALVVSSHVEDGVRLWRVGNPRSRRRIVVVGCPRGPCPGLAVTQRLVNGVNPLAADLRVVQLLRGREDVLRWLVARSRPEATIRLGPVHDPDRVARRIAAYAR